MLLFFQEFVTNLHMGSGNNRNVKFDFFLEKLNSDEYISDETNETYSLSGFTLILQRSPTPFFMNTYLPTFLLTMSSFIGFLIPVDAVPGRMALLVTTFLMLVNISSTEKNRGPEVRGKSLMDKFVCQRLSEHGAFSSSREGLTTQC